jgi:predicted XRE-type DNA-binding protein
MTSNSYKNIWAALSETLADANIMAMRSQIFMVMVKAIDKDGAVVIAEKLGVSVDQLRHDMKEHSYLREDRFSLDCLITYASKLNLAMRVSFEENTDVITPKGERS